MQQPIIKECFADNGEHSHWEQRNLKMEIIVGIFKKL